VGARGEGEDGASTSVQRGSESAEVEDAEVEEDLEGLGEEIERCKVSVCCVCVWLWSGWGGILNFYDKQ
jgi:hypothetical protein